MKGVRGERHFNPDFFHQSSLATQKSKNMNKNEKKGWGDTSQGTLLDKISWGFLRTSLYTFYYIKHFENEHLHRNSFLDKTKINLSSVINIVNIFYLLSTSPQGHNSHFTELPIESCRIFIHCIHVTNCLHKLTWTTI